MQICFYQSVIISCNAVKLNFVSHRPSSFFIMAQSGPPASYTDPQPRRSTRLPKPSKRDPNFIYEDFQRHLQNFDDPDERDLLPSPSLFSDSQGRDQKETKRKVKRYLILVTSTPRFKASSLTSIFTT